MTIKDINREMEIQREFLEREKEFNLSRFIEYASGYPSKIPFEPLRDFIKLTGIDIKDENLSRIEVFNRFLKRVGDKLC